MFLYLSISTAVKLHLPTRNIYKHIIHDSQYSNINASDKTAHSSSVCVCVCVCVYVCIYIYIYIYILIHNKNV